MLERFKNYFKKSAVAMDYNLVPVGQGQRITVDANGDLVYATCIEVLAKTLAQTKWSIYGKDNAEIESTMMLFNKALNLAPYPAINAYDFWHYIEVQRVGTGNGIAKIVFDDAGMLQYLVPLDSTCVNVYWDDSNLLDGKRKIYYEYTDRKTGKTYVMLPEEIFHVKFNSVNGIVGRRSLDVMRETLRSNAEVEGALRTSVVNSWSGTIVLSYTSDLNMQRRKEVQNQIKELLNNSNSMILPLPVGMQASNITNNIEAIYNTLKNTNAQAISAFFGIPLALLNIGSGTGAGVFSTNQMTQFYNTTIAPIVSAYANELSVKLLTNRQMNKGYRFNASQDSFDFLDAQAKASVLSAYTGAGILTPNEARASLLYPLSDDPMANILTQRGGTGALGDSASDEGGNEQGS